MPKPPSSPGPKSAQSSDVKGVRRDQQPVNSPHNADPKNLKKLKHEEDENRGRPAPSRS